MDDFSFKKGKTDSLNPSSLRLVTERSHCIYTRKGPYKKRLLYQFSSILVAPLPCGKPPIDFLTLLMKAHYPILHRAARPGWDRMKDAQTDSYLDNWPSNPVAGDTSIIRVVGWEPACLILARFRGGFELSQRERGQRGTGETSLHNSL